MQTPAIVEREYQQTQPMITIADEGAIEQSKGKGKEMDDTVTKSKSKAELLQLVTAPA